MTQLPAPPAQPAPKPPPAKPARRFMKQPNMLRVLYALVPLVLAGIYLFGWRVLGLLIITTAAGLAMEAVTSRKRGQPISMACFVTCFLFALSLPPTTPFWIAVIGVAVGILFGKEVFGGFGRNFANPAIVGRAFVYVSFPPELTAAYEPAFRNWPGGLTHWSIQTWGHVPGYLESTHASVTDAISQATPMLARQRYGYETPWWDLFTGSIGGTFDAGQEGTRILAAGSIGEVSAALIILAGVYLLVTRTANWRLTVSCLAGAVVANLALRDLMGYDQVPPLPFTLLSGALLYGAVFMVTDPVSAPKKPLAMYGYGAFIGIMVVFLRWRSQFVGAVAFSILLGNIVGPLMDIGANWWTQRRKAAGAPPPAKPEGAA